MSIKFNSEEPLTYSKQNRSYLLFYSILAKAKLKVQVILLLKFIYNIGL